MANSLYRVMRRAIGAIGRVGARTHFALTTSLACVSLVACDPLWSMNISQSLKSATAPECIAATLRARPEVDSLTVLRDGELAFHLREPTGVRSYSPGLVRLERAADTAATLQIELWWHFPAAGVTASPERTRRLTAFGREVAEQVRRACAPEAPSAVSCKIIGPRLLPGGTCDPPA